MLTMNARGDNLHGIPEVTALVEGCVVTVGHERRLCYTIFHGAIPSESAADSVRDLAVALAGGEELY